MAATVSLIQMLAAGVAKSDGTPLSSGRCRFYQPGTLTPVTVYADTAAATAITPPLILTAGGTGVAYTQQPTRLIVKDSTDTLTLFDGNVNTTRAESEYVTSTSFNGGSETRLQTILDAVTASFGGTAGSWLYKAGANAVEQNIKDVITDICVSVKSFGAVGDGIADDTVAIQRAIDLAASRSGGVVLVPGGTYLISSALTITASGISLRGISCGKSNIRNTNATGNALSISTAAGTVIADISFTHATASTGTGISVANTASSLCSMERVIITGHKTSASLSGGSWVIIEPQFISTGAGGNTLVTNTGTVVVAGLLSSIGAADTTVLIGTGSTSIASTSLTAGAVGVNVGAGTSFFATNVTSSATSGLVVSATAVEVKTSACDWGTVTDGRTGAPVAYTFAGNGNFTPLPQQTDMVRAIGTAGGITVTVNAIAACEFGRKWTLYCVNNSGGVVTWAFNAQYKLIGGAVPNPASGNYTAMSLEYDPISGVVREYAARATAAI